MAKEYKVGERYYLPVTVKDGIGTSYNYPVVLEFVDCEGRDTTDTICIANEPDLLLTADEIIDAKIGRTRFEEIKKRYDSDVAELGGEIKTLKYENERLSKQNEELGAKADDLEAELQNAKAAIDRWREIENHNTRYIDKQTQATNRKDKEIEILIDRITKLEAELAEEREKKNG